MKKVLVSTDIGSDIDDALSILTMLNHPEISVSGIHVTNGNVEARAYITRHLVELATNRKYSELNDKVEKQGVYKSDDILKMMYKILKKSKCPIIVAKGEALALNNTIEPYSHFEQLLIPPLFFDFKKMDEINKEVLRSLDGIVKEDGVKEMAETLSKEKHTILSLGPLTNIAKLIQIYPEQCKNIENIYIMGFSTAGESEHNVRFDPLAAEIVASSDLPKIIVPKEVCDQYKMSIEFLSQIETSHGRFVKQMAKAFIAGKTSEKYLTEQIEVDKVNRLPITSLVKNRMPITISLLDEKTRLTANLDVESAYFDAPQFNKDFEGLIQHFRNPENGYTLRNILSNTLESLKPKELSVSDVYVPFCLTNPHEVKTEARLFGNIKQNTVVSLDYKKFEEFLKKYLK
jgi:inosine-uridine nucleoside N-ribohydrolase